MSFHFFNFLDSFKNKNEKNIKLFTIFTVSSDLEVFNGFNQNANTGNLGSWEYLNESTEDAVKLNTINNNFILGDYRNLGFSLPNTTVITKDGHNNVSFLFYDLFVPEQKHWNITRDNPNGWRESLFRINKLQY